MRKVFSLGTFFSIALLAGFLAVSPLVATQALSVQPVTTFNIDPALINQPENYNQPNSILIAPLTLPKDLLIENKEWYEGIFYYMAERLGQGDFLAHYFLTNDGVVLQGNSKSDNQRFLMSEAGDRPVVIIYLAKTDDNDFSFQAKANMGDLILDIANRNAIPLANVKVRSLTYTLKANSPITLNENLLGGLWENSLQTIVKQIAPNYKPVAKQYSLSVVKVDLPTDPVNYGDNIQLSLTLKNNSDQILFQDSDYQPVMAKTSKDPSKFFINGTWLSQSQATVMPENTMLKPGESKIYNVKLKVPLYFGLITEPFQLTNTLGQPYAGTSFNIAVTINHPDKSVVEITSTETGQLNVRDGPWASSNIISRVTPGQRFFVLDRTESGYTKLDLGNDKSGWVLSKYVRSV